MTGPDYESTWTCLDCDEVHIDTGHHYGVVCSNCRQVKPVECELCEEMFLPWKEFEGDRTESGLCQTCYFREPDPSRGVDRDQGEDR